MRAVTTLLIIILLTTILLVDVEMAAAFTGQSFINGFWKLIKGLLDLLFFRAAEEPDDSSSLGTVAAQDKTKKDWTKMQVGGLTRAEEDMLELINQVREETNLAPLKVDYRLVKIARAKSQDMVENNYFDHYSANYGSPFDMMQKLGIDYYLAGENIAGAPEVKLAQQQLMKSKSHRENILHEDFTYIGIGIVKGGPYGKIYTQEFAGLIK